MKDLSLSDISRIIEMTWEDRTHFEAIEIQFGSKENEVREIMRREMKPSNSLGLSELFFLIAKFCVFNYFGIFLIMKPQTKI
jgi:hypothetical protein